MFLRRRIYHTNDKAAVSIQWSLAITLTPVCLMVILLAAGISSARAQTSETEWTEPVLLFKGQGDIHNPVILADTSGRVHVFWRYVNLSQDSSSARMEQIFYTQWDGTSWHNPVDIVASPFIWSFSAAIDQTGLIHLIWSDGVSYNYTRSSVENAFNVGDWSEPRFIANGNPYANIYADLKDRLHLVYPGSDEPGVHYQFSDDHGDTWSAPVTVSEPQVNNSLTEWTFLATSESGIVHVVWTEFQLPQAWPPLGVFHTRSTDGGITWSPAVEIADEGFDQINVAVGEERIVHLAWNGMVGVGGRYHRWSIDDGESWSNTQAIVPQGGSSGPPQLIVDGTGILHLLTTYGGTWYSSWNNQRWQTPQNISVEESDRTGWIEEASLAVNEGNRLHAVFWADRSRLWYTSKLTTAPSLPPKEFPNESPTPTPVMQPASSSPPPTPKPTLMSDLILINQEVKIVSPGLIILLGVLPPICLVLLVYIIKFKKN